MWVNTYIGAMYGLNFCRMDNSRYALWLLPIHIVLKLILCAIHIYRKNHSYYIDLVFLLSILESKGSE